jgi:hypothetical protein
VAPDRLRPNQNLREEELIGQRRASRFEKGLVPVIRANRPVEGRGAPDERLVRVPRGGERDESRSRQLEHSVFGREDLEG